MRLARLSEMSDRPVALKKTFQIFFRKNLAVKKKSLPLQPQSKRWRQVLWKIYISTSSTRDVLIIRNIPSRTTIKRRDSERRYKKTNQQRRVWSWLRMNASDRLNTCKSRGSMVCSNTNWWRPAHGWVTRMQLTYQRGIARRESD